MNYLEIAIINEYNLVLMLNNGDELTECQRDALLNNASNLWQFVTEEEKTKVFNQYDENFTVYQIVKKECDKIMQKYNLKFSDKRVIEYFYDSVFTMVTR